MPSPIATEPQQARARATRRRLLDAAVDELIDHGYVGFTTPGVARRAGVSRGAQQNYFPHKTTLVADFIRTGGRPFAFDLAVLVLMFVAAAAAVVVPLAIGAASTGSGGR